MFPLSLKSLTFDLLSLLLVLPRTTAADPNDWTSARASFLLPAMTTVLCYEKTLFQFLHEFIQQAFAFLPLDQAVCESSSAQPHFSLARFLLPQ